MNATPASLFDLTGRVVVITGGTGFLGLEHATAVAGAGGKPILADLSVPSPCFLQKRLGFLADVVTADVTNPDHVRGILDYALERYGRIDGLINNAANNPRVEGDSSLARSRLESFPLDQWQADLAVGLTGAFLCSRALGSEMARRGKGVILNVASDLAVIAPDQRIYREPELRPDRQPVKPVTYSVVKTGLLGLTRYLATYWADSGVRVNTISPGGVANDQPDDFVARLTHLIPLGRMARPDEYRGAVQFLLSDASSYMTGTNLVIDGGRSCW
jgi:NAD(P)-dependent dehydrogenase (short-subunit alcohol dehydrogenase family)